MHSFHLSVEIPSPCWSMFPKDTQGRCSRRLPLSHSSQSLPVFSSTRQFQAAKEFSEKQSSCPGHPPWDRGCVDSPPVGIRNLDGGRSGPGVSAEDGKAPAGARPGELGNLSCTQKSTGTFWACPPVPAHTKP